MGRNEVATAASAVSRSETSGTYTDHQPTEKPRVSGAFSSADDEVFSRPKPPPSPHKHPAQPQILACTHPNRKNISFPQTACGIHLCSRQLSFRKLDPSSSIPSVSRFAFLFSQSSLQNSFLSPSPSKSLTPFAFLRMHWSSLQSHRKNLHSPCSLYPQQIVPGTMTSFWPYMHFEPSCSATAHLAESCFSLLCI